MGKGDHLVAYDTLHTHLGIDMGGGRVAQYSSQASKLNARIEIVSEADFAQGRSVRVLDRPAVYDPDEIARRVKMRLGEQAYSLLRNNCEHFVNWCRTGRVESRQADRVIERTASVGTKIAARAAARGVTKIATKQGSKLAFRTIARAASPLLIFSDVAQFATELGASRCGANQEIAQRTGQAVGLGTALAVGSATAGPIGACAGIGLWVVGELVGKSFARRCSR